MTGIVRLGPDDRDVARRMFAMLNEVFETEGEALSDGYVQGLLARPDFWALAAVDADERVVGGITAHELPMTRSETRELFLYDLAVRPEVQRRGIGRRLVTSLVALAAAQGITVVFVPADDEDEHAVAFYAALGGRPAPVTMFDLGADGAPTG